MPRYYTLNRLLGIEPEQSAKEIRIFGVKRVNDLSTATITGTGLAFVHSTSAADTITDSGDGLVTAGFKAGDYFRAVGTTLNDGQAWRIVTVAAGTLTLHKDEIVLTEAAGSSFTLDVVTPVPEVGQHLIVSRAALRIAKLYPFLREQLPVLSMIKNEDTAQMNSVTDLMESAYPSQADVYQ